jgi:hypothetical protein
VGQEHFKLIEEARIAVDELARRKLVGIGG